MAPGPYPQPPPGPPGYPPYPPPVMPRAMFTPPPQNDGKAVASLVLGILSVVACFGPLAGIPAIILGFLSKRDIARSGGALSGDGLALGGIITGILSTLMSIGVLIFYVAIIGAAVASAPKYTPPPTPYTTYAPYTTPTTTTTATPPHAPTALKPMPFTGLVRVVDLRPASGSLRTQLALELGAAKDDGKKLLVITASRNCTACDEIFSSFSMYELQKPLRNVRVVRVDVDAFTAELSALGLDQPEQPWFYKLDDSLKIIDSISADEWDDNNAFNIAPVLKSFMAGTYKKRVTTGDAGVRPHVQLSDPL